MMNIAEKRKAGEILERGGISQRIIVIAKDIAEGSYKNAIEKAGQISVLVDSATYDQYWNEKATTGKYREMNVFEDLTRKHLKRDKVICLVNPYDKELATNEKQD